MRKRQGAEGASTENLFAILFQSGDGQASCPGGSGSVAQSALLSGKAFAQRQKGGKQVFHFDSTYLTGVSSYEK
jgi:hypothetical protein